MEKVRGEIKTERFVVPYRVFGDRGPYIVCVNGAAQSMASWRIVTANISKDARIVTFDFPGQGRGEIVSGGYTVDLDEQTGIMARVVDTACDAEPINIVSASWGGLIAINYAVSFPDRVQKMIVGGFSAKIHQRVLDALNVGRERLARGESGFTGKMIVEYFGQQIPDVYKRQIIAQFQNMEESRRQALIAHMFFFEAVYVRGSEIDFAKVKAQTLIINGSKDPIIVPEDAYRFAEQNPNCRVEIIPNVGHFLLFEREDLINMYKDFFLGKPKDSGTVKKL